MDSDRERMTAGRTGYSPAVHGGRPAGNFMQKKRLSCKIGPANTHEGKNNHPKGTTGGDSGGRVRCMESRLGIAIMSRERCD